MTDDKPPAERTRRRRGKAGVSQEEVAARAGVSTATVSRFLNSPDLVSANSRDIVAKAIADLGYIPDGAGRALASRRTRTIGAVLPTLDNPVFAVGIQGLQSRLKQQGYTLLVASHEYDLDEELHGVRTILQQGVDGLMLIGGSHHAEVATLLRGKSIPFVYCWTYCPGAQEPSIGFDNRRAAALIAEHLLDLGHRRFAIIAGYRHDNDRATERVLGALGAIRDRGLDVPAARILERPYTVEQGRAAMRGLMEQADPPSAVICGNDILALGALAHCRASAIHVPREVSVVGFDDLEISAQLDPALTTIHVPAAAMGERAADFLIAQIAGQPSPWHQEVAVELKLRDTTAAPSG